MTDDLAFPCPTCNGAGTTAGAPVPCDDCGGTGEDVAALRTAYRGAVEAAQREVVEAWDAWQADTAFDDPWDRLVKAIDALRGGNGS